LKVPGPASAAPSSASGTNGLLHFGHLTDFPAWTRFGVFRVTPQSGFGQVYETAINNSAIRPLGDKQK
jgi:hypothetical protein